MKVQYEYLKDMDFLKEVFSQHMKTCFIKIIILDWQEEPIEDIVGRVLSGNFTIDNSSIIRRTASLNVLMEDLINNIYNINNLLSINKKVNIEIGYINTTNKYLNYSTLWFPLGIYVITSCNLSNNESGLIASLQLKDKMCLLNGECGGTLPSSVVFDNYTITSNTGEDVVVRPTIYQIIQELINHFGGQQLGKIIIADLDTRVKQVMKWTGSSPLYFLQQTVNNQYYMTLDQDDYLQKIQQGWINIEGSPFEYGEDVGYIFTDFSFPGDLIGDAGSTITDILDKIIGVLGNYEYFYDLNGNFVFQEIKNYLNNTEAEYKLRSLEGETKTFIPDYINAETNSSAMAYLLDMSRGSSVFSFNNSNLISSYTNTFQYTQIKNDYMVWGIRTTPDGYKIPIRYHLAIDEKPTPGNTYQALAYIDPDDEIEKWHVPLKFNSKSSFPEEGEIGLFYMDTSQSSNNIYIWEANNTNYGYKQINANIESITTKDWRTELYFQGVMAEPYGVNSNYYFTELITQWPKIYDIRKGQFKEEAVKNSSGIDFYLDFIDTNTELKQFSIGNIGRRTMVLNEDENVNCVFEPWIPDVILINKEYSGTDENSMPAHLRQECDERNQQYYQVSNQIYSMLATGGTLNSAYQIIRQLIHEYTSYNNSVSLQTLPLFFLQPNTRITINDTKSNIYGDYLITRLSFNIDTSSYLTINAIKALEKI